MIHTLTAGISTWIRKYKECKGATPDKTAVLKYNFAWRSNFKTTEKCKIKYTVE